MYKFLFDRLPSILLGLCIGVELLGQMVGSSVSFIEDYYYYFFLPKLLLIKGNSYLRMKSMSRET